MPQVIYRVVYLADGRWEHWTNYRALDDAILAANGLVLSKEIKAQIVHIVEIRTDGGRIVAELRKVAGKVEIFKRS